MQPNIFTISRHEKFLGKATFTVSSDTGGIWSASTDGTTLSVFKEGDESRALYTVEWTKSNETVYTYPIKDINNQTIAVLSHNLAQSFVRSTWQINNPAGSVLANITISTLRSLLGHMIWFVPYNYIVYVSNEKVCAYKEHGTLFGKRSFTVEFSGGSEQKFNQVIGLLSGIIMLRYDSKRGRRYKGSQF
jgi:hypothetical protein